MESKKKLLLPHNSLTIEILMDLKAIYCILAIQEEVTKLAIKSKICISAGDLSLRSYRFKYCTLLEKNLYHIMYTF